MFSGFELTVIMKWAKTGKDILISHLNSPLFTHEEKEDKRREYDALDSIIEETKRIQTEYVSLDADHLCYMMAMLEKYHAWVNEQVKNAEMSTMDYGAAKYQIGYMQGRLELGLLTSDDVEVIQEWELEMNK